MKEEMKEKNIYRYGNGELFEFGYCITGHLSQGSQFDSVLVYNEYLSRAIYKKWLYTVITRAKEFLLVAI